MVFASSTSVSREVRAIPSACAAYPAASVLMIGILPIGLSIVLGSPGDIVHRRGTRLSVTTTS